MERRREASHEPIADEHVELVYIHTSAFAHHALMSETAASAVGYGIAAMRAHRIASHHLEQAVDVQAMTPEQASAILRHTTLEDRWYYTESKLLADLGYQNRNNRGVRSGHYVPVSGSNMQLASTCFDSEYGGYYTLSFSGTAAEQMFADDTPFAELNQSIADGNGPGNLVVVHGYNRQGLVPLPDDQPWRPDLLVQASGFYNAAAAVKKYRKQHNFLANQVITPADAIQIDNDARNKYKAEVIARLRRYKELPETWAGADLEYVESQMTVLQNIIAKVLRDPSYSRRPENFLPMESVVELVGPYQWEHRALVEPSDSAPRIRPDHKNGLSPKLYHASDLALAA